MIKNIYKQIKKHINIFVLFTVILVIFVFIIIILFLREKNTAVQQYLGDIQKRLNKNKLSSIINEKCEVIYENNIIIVNDFLNKDYFNNLRHLFDNKNYNSRDLVIRKGSGIDFQKLHENKEYHDLLEIYYSNKVLDFLSKIVNKPVQRISLSDPNASSLLIYSKKGDYINWHYDYSNYYGDRYVVLLTFVNENEEKNGGLSNNIFQYNYKGQIYDLKMKENSVVIFKGSEILHQSTEIENNERRILLSMVYCDICQEKKNVFNIMYEGTKNFVVYGTQ
jgi:hypothetical protein